MAVPIATNHQNRVLVEPARVLVAAINEATRRGYRVLDVGSSLHGDVHDVVALVAERLSADATGDGPFCIVGVGEVTLRVRGSGVGGRCQEFAWRMAGRLTDTAATRVAARATDGRDFVKGIAGGWVDETTLRRARERGIDWGHVVEESDSFTALADLGHS